MWSKRHFILTFLLPALSQLLGFDPESPFDFLPKTQEENVSSYQDKENGIQALWGLKGIPGVAQMNASENSGMMDPLPIHTIHSCKGNTNEISWLHHWDLVRWDHLRLPLTTRHMASNKDSLQRMNKTVLSWRNSRSRSNHISSLGYGTLSPYIYISVTFQENGQVRLFLHWMQPHSSGPDSPSLL